MKILGIDPGSSRIGYGLILKSRQPQLIRAGALDYQERDPYKKMLRLGQEYRQLLITTTPDLVALEKIFFSRNTKTAIEVAQARGVMLFLTLQQKIPIVEYGPTQVKQAVTSYGLADKKAVAKMVKAILNISLLKQFDDVSDALAVAITAINHKL